ncbi:MAG: YolD-like family protein [Clostridiaceae bacterium]|nr:YolD-like family protein [Clostridiaceae bacterium]
MTTASGKTPAEETYKDIINLSWRKEVQKSTPSFFIKHPQMSLENRAKIFAPFAALRGHSDRLSEETGKLLRSEKIELSEEEAAVLSDKLLQVKKSMEVTVVYFEPDSEGGSVGYDISLTGTVAEIDAIYRILKINTGVEGEKGEIVKTVKFDDLLDVSGDGIVGIDEFLEIEEYAEHEDCGDYEDCDDFPADE